MKIDLAQLQPLFQSMLRGLQLQTWERVDGLVAWRSAPFADIPMASGDLGYNFEEDYEPEKLRELTNVLTTVAEGLAQEPAIRAAEALASFRCHEIHHVAGSDCLDPAEIRSALARAIGNLGADSVLVVYPHGAQSWFLAALDATTPGSVGKCRVRLQHASEIVDRVAMAELYPTGEDGTTSNRLTTDVIQEILRRSPFYVIDLDGQSPFDFEVKTPPELANVDGKLHVRWAARLRENDMAGDAPVRIRPSNLVIARQLPAGVGAS